MESIESSEILDNLEPIIFQIIDWNQHHENEENSDLDELDKELEYKEDFLKYKIRLFGRTNNGKSIYVNVNEYTPFFYIKIPNEWNITKVMTLINYIKNKISSSIILKGFKKFEIIESKDLYGFTAYKNFKFVRLIFQNMKSYKTFEYWIEKNKIDSTSLFKKPTKLQIYE